MNVSEKIDNFIYNEGKGSIRDALNVALTWVDTLRISHKAVMEELEGTLPKRLSNEAYKNARKMRYEDFVTWWGMQDTSIDSESNTSDPTNCIYLDFLGEKEVNEVWKTVNFGPESKSIETIGRNVVNVAYGYHIGSGAYSLLKCLGLVRQGKNKIKLTTKGHEFLGLPFAAQ